MPEQTTDSNILKIKRGFYCLVAEILAGRCRFLGVTGFRSEGHFHSPALISGGTEAVI